MTCGGCNKKKKVSKLPSDYKANDTHRSKILSDFMNRKDLIKKR